MAIVLEDMDRTTWLRREAKRRIGVRAVKASLDYQLCDTRPQTPDAFDNTLSKRRWEKYMQEWRYTLRTTRILQCPSDWLCEKAPCELPTYVPFGVILLPSADGLVNLTEGPCGLPTYIPFKIVLLPDADDPVT